RNIPVSLSLPNHAATITYRSPLSLHDALPISPVRRRAAAMAAFRLFRPSRDAPRAPRAWRFERGARRSMALGRLGLLIRPLWGRSEENTSELQSPYDLVCRLLLEKKNSS